MTNSINITISGEVIYLTTGIYSVKVIGGWDVKLGNFDLQLTKVDNGQKIFTKNPFGGFNPMYVRKEQKKYLAFPSDNQEIMKSNF